MGGMVRGLRCGARVVGALIIMLAAGGVVAAQGVGSAGAEDAGAMHGLKVGPTGRYLVDAVTGEPVFLLADTAWNLGALKLEEVDRYLTNRARLGFNVIMFAANFSPQAKAENAYGHAAYQGADMTELNPAYFKTCDAVIAMAERRGLYVMLYAMWAGEKSGTMNRYTAAQLSELGRALGEHYRGRANVILCAGGESTPHYIDVERVGALGSALKQGCGGLNLVTVHPVSEHSGAEFFAAAEWLDFSLSQGKSSLEAKSVAFDAAALVARDFARTPAKPAVMAEHRYESGTSEDPLVQRRSMYQCVLAGGCGYGYGHNGLWQMTPHTAQPWMLRNWNPGVKDWTEALDAPGAAQLQHAKALIESLPSADRFPDQSLVIAGQGADVATRIQAARDGTPGADDATYLVAYAGAGGPFSLATSAVAAGTLTVRQYEPATGELADERRGVANTGTLAVEGGGAVDRVVVVVGE